MKKNRSIISKIICGMIGSGIGYLWSMNRLNKVIDEKEARIDKFVGYFNLLDHWMMIKEEGKSISGYFQENGYLKIAIYGLGKMGNHLLKELKDTNIQVLYAIDTKGDAVCNDTVVYTLNDKLPDTDLIVVTPVFDYDNIERSLREKTDTKIVSLNSVVYGIL